MDSILLGISLYEIFDNKGRTTDGVLFNSVNDIHINDIINSYKSIVIKMNNLICGNIQHIARFELFCNQLLNLLINKK